MDKMKTTAIVKSPNNLELKEPLTNIMTGQEIQIVVIPPKPSGDWKKVLLNMGTYSDEELEELAQIRKDINNWKPRGF